MGNHATRFILPYKPKIKSLLKNKRIYKNRAPANNLIAIRYYLDATSHSRGQHLCVQVNIYTSDQAKSFESGEFTQENLLNLL